MRIVINQGANLPDRAIAHYPLIVAPAHIVVDGKSHDPSEGVSHEQLDDWVKHAREFPHLVGTTAQEFAHMFTEIARDDSEIVVVAASRKLIGTYAAASSAARTVQERAAYFALKIAVVDSMLVDIGPGMLALAAGEAMRANLPMRKTVSVLETMASRARFCSTVATLDNLVRGGRASFLRAWVANFLNIKPLLAMENGEVANAGKIKGNADRAEAMANELSKTGAGRRVWVGIAHGSDLTTAHALRRSLEKKFDVVYSLTIPVNPTAYLHAGRGSIFAVVFPIDDLGWELPTPPDFSLG
ncbi:MAG: DegV family protein [Polyangiaceae bacterium]